MDLSQLRTFIAAAETGSFSSAAELVHASPSSVTERIATLEARLSARLFERSRRGCVLTDAGARFLPRARSIASIWEMSRAEAAIPPLFSAQARIGGQYALWPDFLMPWITALQAARPSLALTLTAGASARLNRDLASQVIDLAVLYSPVIGPGVESRQVLNDRLILVCAADCHDWREAWVDIDWGEALRLPIAEAVGEIEPAGLRLDIGGMALPWLLERKSSGYLPERLARRELQRGQIVEVPGYPSFDYPAYALWNRWSELEMEPVVEALISFVQANDSLIARA